MSIVKSVAHPAKRRSLVLIACSMMLLTANAFLIKQNRVLKAYTSQLDRSKGLQPGTRLPALEGLGLQGERINMSFGTDARKTLLLVFAPGCGACNENALNWQLMMNRLDEAEYRIVGVSLVHTGTNEYVAQHKLKDITVFADVDATNRAAYSLMLTPQTILIGADGTTEKVWSGNLLGSDRQDLESSLHLQLTR